MRKIYFILSLLLFALKLCAQDFKKNAAYIELAGNGIIYSVNYDRVIPLSNQFKLAPRVGIALLPTSKNSDYSNLILPIEINPLWAKNKESKNHFEFGVGLNLVTVKIQFVNDPSETIYLAKVTTGRLGFRHQKPTGGFMYRVGLVLPIAEDNNAKIKDLKRNYFGGISLGYTF